MKMFTKKSVWVGLCLSACLVTLYAQEPQVFERGGTFLRGNITASTGSVVLGPGGGGTIILEGATANAYETTLSVSDPSADRSIVFPNAAGTVVIDTDVYSALSFTIEDDIVLSFGTTDDTAFVNSAAGLAANTTLANVIVGTPVTPAVAANSLIISNITADGDIMMANQTGGNSHTFLWADASANTVSLYGAGVRMLQVDSTSANLGLAGTTTGRLELSGATSGTISILPGATAGTYTLTLPGTSTNAALMYSTLTTNAIDVANSVWGISNGMAFGGATGGDGFETTLTPVDPTADRTITLPNLTGVVALTGALNTGIIGHAVQAVTVNGATTFAITSNVVTLACTGAEDIATITGGIAGQFLTIENTDTECTVKDDDDATAANAIDLTGTATDDVGAVKKVLVLYYNGTDWQEVAESDN